jgi:hypothetical protein
MIISPHHHGLGVRPYGTKGPGGGAWEVTEWILRGKTLKVRTLGQGFCLIGRAGKVSRGHLGVFCLEQCDTRLCASNVTRSFMNPPAFPPTSSTTLGVSEETSQHGRLPRPGRLHEGRQGAGGDRHPGGARDPILSCIHVPSPLALIAAICCSYTQCAFRGYRSRLRLARSRRWDESVKDLAAGMVQGLARHFLRGRRSVQLLSANRQTLHHF